MSGSLARQMPSQQASRRSLNLEKRSALKFSHLREEEGTKREKGNETARSFPPAKSCRVSKALAKETQLTVAINAKCR